MSRQNHQVFTDIMATTNQGDIGFENGLPWGKPNKVDMEWFVKATKGRHCFISQKTLDTIPNGLPGRVVEVLTRPPINKCLFQHVKSISPQADAVKNTGTNFFDYPTTNPILLGGKTIYEQYSSLIHDYMITFIPGTYKSDCKFDLMKFSNEGWDVSFAGQSMGKDKIGFIHFTRNLKDDDHTQNNLITDMFEPYYRLTASETIIIKPGAHGVIAANEFVGVPKCATGVFSIRKSFAKKGLLTSASNFKRNWIGYPELVVSNRGLDTITIMAGEEIGELAFLDNAGYTN